MTEMLSCRKMETNRVGQAVLEFTFSMVILVLLIMGLIKVFLWTGIDLAERRKAHERVLTQTLPGTEAVYELRQIRPTFFFSAPVNAAWASNIYGNRPIDITGP